MYACARWSACYADQHLSARHGRRNTTSPASRGFRRTTAAAKRRIVLTPRRRWISAAERRTTTAICGRATIRKSISISWKPGIPRRRTAPATGRSVPPARRWTIPAATGRQVSFSGRAISSATVWGAVSGWTKPTISERSIPETTATISIPKPRKAANTLLQRGESKTTAHALLQSGKRKIGEKNGIQKSIRKRRGGLWI